LAHGTGDRLRDGLVRPDVATALPLGEEHRPLAHRLVVASGEFAEAVPVVGRLVVVLEASATPAIIETARSRPTSAWQASVYIARGVNQADWRVAVGRRPVGVGDEAALEGESLVLAPGGVGVDGVEQVAVAVAGPEFGAMFVDDVRVRGDRLADGRAEVCQTWLRPLVLVGRIDPAEFPGERGFEPPEVDAVSRVLPAVVDGRLHHWKRFGRGAREGSAATTPLEIRTRFREEDDA